MAKTMKVAKSMKVLKGSKLKVKSKPTASSTKPPSILHEKKFFVWEPKEGLAFKKAELFKQWKEQHGPMTAEQIEEFNVNKFFTKKQVSHLWMDLKRKSVPSMGRS